MSKQTKQQEVQKVLKRIIDSPYTKASTLALGVAGFGLRLKNEIKSKKYKDEQLEVLKSIDKKLENMDKNDNSKEKKEKKFSIKGGGRAKPDPQTIITRAIKYTAENSVFNLGQLRNATSSDFIDAFIKSGGVENVNFFINRTSDCSHNITIYYKGETLVIYANYLSEDAYDKLNKILEKYCSTFKDTSYFSENPGSNISEYIIELSVKEDTEKLLASSFIKSGLKVNIIK